METIAKIKTPKGEWKVVKYLTVWGTEMYRIWSEKRHRHWRIYETEEAAVKAMIEMAASGYLISDEINV